jgi:hypothetical protein
MNYTDAQLKVKPFYAKGGTVLIACTVFNLFMHLICGCTP